MLLYQLADSAHFLKYQQQSTTPTAGSFTPGGDSSKCPFFHLLPADVKRGWPASVVPLALARHPREETKEQVGPREQRDACFEKHGFNKFKPTTWGRLSQEERAVICTEMFKPPARWNWAYTQQRCTEKISKSRAKGSSKTPAVREIDLTDSSSPKATGTKRPREEVLVSWA